MSRSFVPRWLARHILLDISPLRESRDFRALVAGVGISVLGNQLTMVSVPFQVCAITHSSLVVGLVSLAQLFPLIFGSVLGGSVVAGGPRLGDLEAGAVAAAFGNAVSVVSGGIACVAGAVLVARALPRFARYRMPVAEPAKVAALDE